MASLRQSRLRTGATDWALYQDSQNPRLFIELFSVASWDEHLRQHRERQTGTDQQYHDDAAALSDPRRKPATTWPQTSATSESRVLPSSPAVAVLLLMRISAGADGEAQGPSATVRSFMRHGAMLHLLRHAQKKQDHQGASPK